MPKPARFAHVTLQSYDLKRLKDWYCSVFGLEVLAENERAVIATYDEEHHRFALVQMAGKPPAGERPPSNLKHVAYAYDSLQDLFEQYRHMKHLGCMPVECVNHGPTLSFYYEDPDGNGVEFFVDRFDTMAQSKAFMASEPFQKNLFGYRVDPEALLAQHDSGASKEAVLHYPPHGAQQPR